MAVQSVLLTSPPYLLQTHHFFPPSTSRHLPVCCFLPLPFPPCAPLQPPHLCTLHPSSCLPEYPPPHPMAMARVAPTAYSLPPPRFVRPP